MNWLRRLPNSPRAASGLEWALWRKLPTIAWVGTLCCLSLGAALHWWFGSDASAKDVRWLQMVDYVLIGALIFHATMLLTVAVGCVVVIIMKGPGYGADSYPVSHSDRPRKHAETEDEMVRRPDGV